jgi:hypothetical protein
MPFESGAIEVSVAVQEGPVRGCVTSVWGK